MNSSNIVNRNKVAGLLTASAYMGSPFQHSACFNTFKNGQNHEYLFFSLSISMPTITILSESIISYYTFIFIMSFGQKGLKQDGINVQLIQSHMKSVTAKN